MKRRLVTLAAAASLVLCIATGALWVRSHWRNDSINLEFGKTSLCANSLRGRISLLFVRNYPERLRLFETTPAAPQARPLSPFGATRFDTGDPQLVIRALWFPFWSLLIAEAGVALVVIGRRFREATDDCCTSCGYDLRATPDRCPECGAAPAAPAAR